MGNKLYEGILDASILEDLGDTSTEYLIAKYGEEVANEILKLLQLNNK